MAATQEVTASDIKKNQIRIPRGAVPLFPAGKADGLTIDFGATGGDVGGVSWYDGVGPRKTTSGQLRFAKADRNLRQLVADGVVAQGRKLTIAPGGAAGRFALLGSQAPVLPPPAPAAAGGAAAEGAPAGQPAARRARAAPRAGASDLGRLGLLPRNLLCEQVMARLCATDLARLAQVSPALGLPGPGGELPLVAAAAQAQTSQVEDLVSAAGGAYEDSSSKPIIWTEATVDTRLRNGTNFEYGQNERTLGATSHRAHFDMNNNDIDQYGMDWEQYADVGVLSEALVGFANLYPRVGPLPMGGYGSPIAAAVEFDCTPGYGICGINPMRTGLHAAEFYLLNGWDVAVGVAAPDLVSKQRRAIAGGQPESDFQDDADVYWRAVGGLGPYGPRASETNQPGDVVGILLDLTAGGGAAGAGGGGGGGGGRLRFFLNGKLIPPDAGESGAETDMGDMFWNIPQGQLRGPLCWCARVRGEIDEHTDDGTHFGVVRGEHKSDVVAQQIAARLATGATDGYPFGGRCARDAAVWEAARATIDALRPPASDEEEGDGA
jgi:hypothetical protein